GACDRISGWWGIPGSSRWPVASEKHSGQAPYRPKTVCIGQETSPVFIGRGEDRRYASAPAGGEADAGARSTRAAGAVREAGSRAPDAGPLPRGRGFPPPPP